MLKNSKLTIWISAIPLIFIVQFAKENPSFTEAYYSKLLLNKQYFDLWRRLCYQYNLLLGYRYFIIMMSP